MTPSTPNDLINTDGGQFVFSMWTAKINGSYELPLVDPGHAGAALPVGTALRPDLNATAAYGIGGAGGINYGSARILRGADRHPEAGRHHDLRLPGGEVLQPAAAARRIGVFFDVYNLTNSDAYQNITWNAGSPSSCPALIVPPTIARFGMKFDW